MSTIDYYRRKRLINTVVGDAGLGYKEDDSIKCPCTDGKKIMMPPFDAAWDDEKVQNWMFSLLHECYHNMGNNKRDFAVLKEKEIGQGSELGYALNILVDHNIERKEHGKFEGADKYCHDSYQKNLARISKEIDKFPDMLGAFISFDMLCRSDWLRTTDFNCRESLSEEGKAKYDKLLPFREEYQEGREGGMPNYDLCLRMLDEMGEDTDAMQQAANEAYQSGEGEGEGEPQDGSGEDGSPTDRSSAGDGEADSSSDKGEDSKAKAARAKARYKDLGLDGHTHTPLGAVTSLDIDYDNDDWDNPEGYEMDKESVIEEANHSPCERGERWYESTSFTLSNKIRNLLKVMSQAKWQGGKKKGKIKAKRLATVPLGNDRIFKQKEMKDVLDTSVSVLVDASGSMEWNRWEPACKAAMMINDCLNRLSIPVEIGAFTTVDSIRCRHIIMSPHNVKTDNLALANGFANFRDLHNNNDGESILWIHDRLLRQKQKRKVLIVLSDGQPAGKCKAAPFTAKVVSDIEKYSPVEIYGIGIETDTVKEIYSKTKVINSTDELESALLSVLKESIIN